MKSISYNIRLDPAVKSEAEKTFAALGLNLSDAINVFLRKSIMHYGFPFDVTAYHPNAALRASIEEADVLLASQNVKGFATVEELNAAMDAEDKAEENGFV